MSDDFTKLYAQMMAQGQEMAKSMAPDFDITKMADMFPTMPADMMEQFMGKGVSPDGLDAKTRLLLTLGALTVQGAQAEDPIRLTVRHALEAGATVQEVTETISQMAAFAGVPAMTKAMGLAQAEIEKKGGTA
jgi:4-carboxymuconolactone decarboxylase